MAKAPTTTYGNDSISMLKGAERVRKRPSADLLKVTGGKLADIIMKTE